MTPRAKLSGRVITTVDAHEIAKRHVQSLSDDLSVFEEPIRTGDFGWVFGYQSSAFAETNDVADALVGNAPILVDRISGQVFNLGTAHEVDKYIQSYKRFGDPLAEPGPTLQLVNWRTGANKVAATKEIKTHTELGLKGAKKAVDNCLSGKQPLVSCIDAETAEVLARKLEAVGFEARQLGMQ